MAALQESLDVLHYKINTTFHEDHVSHQRTTPSGEKFDETWKQTRRLGGGQGLVTLEEEATTGQVRAVKRILVGNLESSEKERFQANLIQEFRRLVELNKFEHLVVKFLGWYEDRNFIFLTTEFVEHGDLAQYLKEFGPKLRSNAEEITRQLLEGLVVLHERGICHGNLKPQNILIASRSPIRVKLADFGISKSTTGTSLRTRIGTPAYMAPELLGVLPQGSRPRRDLEFIHPLNRQASRSRRRPEYIDYSRGSRSSSHRDIEYIHVDYSRGSRSSSHRDIEYIHVDYPRGARSSSHRDIEYIDYSRGSRSSSHRDIEYLDYPRSPRSSTEFIDPLPRGSRSRKDPEYTNAVDLWSLGCLIYKILTSEGPFQQVTTNCASEIYFSESDSENETVESTFDLNLLSQFCLGKIALPVKSLQKAQVSDSGIDFIKRLLVPDPSSRISAVDALKSRWIRTFIIINGYKLRTTLVEGDLVVLIGDTNEESRWRETRLIGGGSFGSVWLWKEVLDGRVLASKRRAIKKLPRDFYRNNNIDFTRELRALIEVRNYQDLFVQFVGWYDDQSFIYLSMEYVEHGDLERYLNKYAPKAKSEVKEITRQLLEGLVVLHERHICHRDLKPQNVLIASNSRSPIRVKLCDFGVSKSTIDSKLRTRYGTQGYMAPELQGCLPRKIRPRGGTEHTNAVDMWSLGCLVYRILTSETPFLESVPDSDYTSGVATCTITRQTDMEFLKEFCNDPRKFPTETLQKSGVSDKGIDFVRGLLVPDPKVRMSAEQALSSDWLCDDIALIQPGVESDSHTVRRQLSTLGVQISERSSDYLIEQSNGRRMDVHGYLPSCMLRDIRKLRYQAVSKGYVMLLEILLRIRTTSTKDIELRIPDWTLLPATDHCSTSDHEIDLINLEDDERGLGSRARTLLQAAAETGYLEVVQLLLDRSAKVNAEPAEVDGRTALQAAAACGHLQVAELLLTSGAIVNASPCRFNGRTALQAAAEGGHFEVVKLLLDNGADANAEPCHYNGRTALRAAAEHGYLELVRLLLENGARANFEADKNNSRTALEEAAEGGHIQVVKLLLESGAEIDTIREKETSRTALQAAAEVGHLEVVQVLLERGADVNIEPSELGGRTALQAAAGGGHLEVARLLLDKDADTNSKPSEFGGRTALQAAAEGGYLEVLQLLLDRSANVNEKPSKSAGRTALQAAAHGGYLQVVELLLASGAKVNADPCENEGRTALQAAAEVGNLEVVKLLLENDADVNADPSEVAGRTALQAAAEGGHDEVVRLLIDTGADVNADPGEASGRTALQAAAGGGKLEVVRLLLECDADVNAEPSDFDGRTALQAAVEGGYLDVVRLLLENDADINAEGSPQEGRTAMEATNGCGNPEILQLLLQWNAGIERPEPTAPRVPAPLERRASNIRVLSRKDSDIDAPPSEPVSRITHLHVGQESRHRGVARIPMGGDGDSEHALDANLEEEGFLHSPGASTLRYPGASALRSSGVSALRSPVVSFQLKQYEETDHDDNRQIAKGT